MKICRTESFDVQHFQKRHGSTGRMTHPKRRSKEFGHFWDNGYEDKA